MTSRDLTMLVQLACLLEVSAPKPGNIAPGRHFADTRFEDFLASAVAIGPSLACVASPLGACIRAAVQATAVWARRNTNLGIVLLLAPLVKAAGREGDLRTRLREVLAETTVEDASNVYAAVRLAAPGGLGQVEHQDIAGEPSDTLTAVMTLARERDAIAREYASGFETTFGVGAPALSLARHDGIGWDWAIVETYLTLLVHAHDTHIIRRAGADAAATASAMAREVLTCGGVRSASGLEALSRMDATLRRGGNALNPGATADLTAAAVFVSLLRDGWRLEEGERPW